MNCIAIDDEPLALKVIEKYCSEIELLNLSGKYTNALEAISELHKKSIDLIFLDVEMPNINGLDFIRSLQNPPIFILTSAHPKYAINGFELDAADYLLKPILFEKFLKAVNKAHSLILQRENNEFYPDDNEERKLRDYMFVKVDYSTIKISFSEIEYIEGLKDYVKIHMHDKSIITKSTIKHLQCKLPDEYFQRVHKSFIVSMDKINKIENNRIFINGKKIPIGMQFKDVFHYRIAEYKL